MICKKDWAWLGYDQIFVQKGYEIFFSSIICMQNYYKIERNIMWTWKCTKRRNIPSKKILTFYTLLKRVMTYIKLKWHAWQLHNLNHSTCYLLPLSGSFWEPLVWIGLDRDIIVVRRTVSARSAIWRFDGVAIFMLPKSAIFPLERPRYYRKGDNDLQLFHSSHIFVVWFLVFWSL